MWDQMKTIKSKVEALLQTRPETRESDARLVSTFLYFEIGKDRLTEMNGVDFLAMIAEGTVTHSDAITRVARKLKEHYPELRGKNDKERKKEEELVREQIVKGLL
jgi:hypothetical protein